MKLSIKHQLFSSIGIISIFFILVVIIKVMMPSYQSYSQAQYLKQANQLTDAVLIEAKYHALERGFSNAQISHYKKNKQIDSQLQSRILKHREAGDKALQQVFSIADEIQEYACTSKLFKSQLQTLKKKYQDVAQMRQQIDALAEGGSISSQQWLKTMSDMIQIGAFVRQSALIPQCDVIINIVKNIKQSSWRISEYAGIERAMIAQIISSGSVVTLEQEKILERNRGIVDIALVKLDYNINNLNNNLSAENVALAEDQNLIQSVNTARQKMHRLFLEQFEKTRQTVYSQFASGHYSLSPTQWLAESTEAINSVIDINLQLSALAEKQFEKQGADAISVLWMAVVILIISFFIIIVSYFVVYNISKQINIMKRQLSDATENLDISQRFSCSNASSELHEMAQAYNSLIKGINAVIIKMLDASIDITDSSSLMTMVAQETNNGIRLQEVETIEVTDNINNMIETITDVAVQSKQASETAVEAREQAQDSLLITEKTTAAIKHLAQEINDAETVMLELQQHSQEIGGIVSVIQGIAEQTNLLALNAAIEAARAGESGRGFAVVADEVRNLAQKTQQATQQIEKIISGLKNSSSQAVDVMQKSNTQANKGVEYIDQTSASLDQIAHSITLITDINVEIAQKTDKQVTIFSNLSGNMLANVEQFTSMLSESVNNSYRAATQLNESVTNLKSSIGKYQLDVNPVLLLHAAKASHLAWESAVQAYINGSNTNLSNVSHTECDFGRWYYSNDTTYLHEVEEFQAMEEPHRKIHELSGQLLQSSVDPAQLSILGKEINELSHEITGLLDAIAERFAMQRHSIMQDYLNSKKTLSIDEDDSIDFF